MVVNVKSFPQSISTKTFVEKILTFAAQGCETYSSKLKEEVETTTKNEAVATANKTAKTPRKPAAKKAKAQPAPAQESLTSAPTEQQEQRTPLPHTGHPEASPQPAPALQAPTPVDQAAVSQTKKRKKSVQVHA